MIRFTGKHLANDGAIQTNFEEHLDLLNHNTRRYVLAVVEYLKSQKLSVPVWKLLPKIRKMELLCVMQICNVGTSEFECEDRVR
jgi:hypothetical protein